MSQEGSQGLRLAVIAEDPQLLGRPRVLNDHLAGLKGIELADTELLDHHSNMRQPLTQLCPS